MEPSRSEATGIAYTSSGKDEDPLVLCLHGFPDIPRTWDPLTRVLVDEGFRVVSPWLPGYAPSSLEGDLDVVSISRRLATLIDELSPGTPIRLVGHDWGGLLSYVLLSQHPDRFRAASILAIAHPLNIQRTIIDYPRQLLRSSYIGFFQVPAVPERMIRVRDFAFVKRLWRIWSPGFELEAGYFEELKACLDQSLPAPLTFYRTLRSPKVIRALLDALNTDPIPVPTLCLHGEQDGCMTVDLAAGQERYFSALFEMVTLAEAGHFLHLERPMEVNASIKDWFLAH